MRKNVILAIVTILLIPFIIKAEWVSLNNKSTAQSPPMVTLISSDNNASILKFDISGFDLKNIKAEGGEYQLADLLAESFTTKTGFPELPYIAKVLAVPDQANVSVEILETGDILTFPNINLPPARESWEEGQPESLYIENLRAYGSTKIYPSESVKIEPPSIFRDFRIARISVFPVRYFAAKKELQVVTSITVRINYGKGEAKNPKTSPKKSIAHSFGQLYRSFIFNYQSVLDDNYGGKEEEHELMLCIMPDDVYESFQPYADWKRKSGIDIHITKFSDIGANSSDYNIIKNHIVDAYLNWEVPPTYVLLVGDDGIFPVYSYGNENFFGEIEGDDYFPDVMVGRLTNQSDYQMQVMINKFQLYEQIPYTASTDWFKKGICCSNDAYASQVETKRFTASQMMDYGNFTSVDTMMDSSPCNYTLSDALNAINSGRSFLNYRGEGWSSGWNNYCVEMETSDVNTLANGQKLTFVTSIGCGVAMFAGGSNCFGEAWIELGTISNPRGAAAFIGPAGNTHTTYNNKIDKGIYVGMFQEGMDTPGQAMLRGKLYMYNVFGNTSSVESHYKLYCVLGDASIHIWKDVPREITVDHPASVTFGTTLVPFTVTHTASGQPVSNAVVCITGDTLFSTGITDEFGLAFVEVEAQELETFNITVRGGNVIPFQGTMIVAPPIGPYVIQQSIELNDGTGNNNGIMETGEAILATLTVENIGVESADNVTVSLETTDEYVDITDGTEFYGYIDASTTSFVTDGFAWEVADNIPDLHNVVFEVSATDGTETWFSYVEIQGHAPTLEIGKMTIDDSEQGNGNGRLDAGETADIYFETYNNGSYEAINSLGEIFTENPFITLNNVTHDFGTIESGTMEEAVFNITVDIITPIGESVEVSFSMTSGGYYIEKSFYTKVGLILEDWEGGDMTQFDWQTGGSSDWFISDEDPYEGVYSAESGNIGDNQDSWIKLDYEVDNPDSISFYFKISSESNYDYLRFYIDNIEKGEWSGTVNWQKASYPVTDGNHTFKWEYDKDFSISTGSDCAWIDFIELPNTVMQALFIADNTEPCIEDEIEFSDLSSGQPTSWQWTFEGGSPASSIEQHPSVLYTTEGIYDVSLTVSDGFYNNTLTLNDYITVSSFPDIPPIPDGPDEVCGNDIISSYNTTGLTGINSYLWLLEPSDAGVVNGTGLTSTIVWENGFLGEAALKVAGENICGTSDYSDAFNINRYLPEVTLEPFDWVCLGWPSFQLTQGLPAGGEYSGPGVENGWFDPTIAGIGTHTITYTYSDLEECENFATETILVDPCTNINELSNDLGINIYPNPSSGIITVELNENIDASEIIVVNTLNKIVYSASIKKISQKKIIIDLSSQSKGIYFIKLKTDKNEEKLKFILK